MKRGVLMMKKKGFITLLLGMSLTLLTAPVMAQNIILQINGQTIQPAVAPILAEGTTLVPIRVVSENLGATVDWNNDERSITINKDDQTIRLVLDQTEVTVNGQTIEAATAPCAINGTTMVPIRLISQNLNCAVEWDSATQTIKIASNDETAASAKLEEPTQQETAASEEKPAIAEKTTTPQYSGGHQVISDENYVVYITKTGEKYHEGNCSSLRKSKIATTLGEATDGWYDACDKCNPPILAI